MNAFDYDLFVIGAGSGGVRAARLAAKLGARVGIAEESRVGGTCVIRGCIPKKILVYASRFAETFEDATGYGWTTEKVKFDWPTLLKNKDGEIDRLNKIYRHNLETAGAELFKARATLEDRHTISLSSGKKVTAQTILIATGSSPVLPTKTPGYELGITSNEALELPTLPQRICIVGGGYIAVEFAGIFNGLGVDTIQLYRGEKILRGFDHDLQDHLTAEMIRKGVDIRTRMEVTRIEKTGPDLRLTLSDGSLLKVGQILFATGRAPNITGLGLEKIGVALNQSRIAVDEYNQTSVDNIYALGDVVNTLNLTPVAIAQGQAFAERLYGNKPQAKADLRDVATAVFSQPEVATVGLTEQQARTVYKQVDIYKTNFRPMRNVISGNPERTLYKLVVDGETDKLLGCHLCGEHSGELIQLLSTLVRLGATKHDLDQTMPVHPTAAEELITLRDKWQA